MLLSEAGFLALRCVPLRRPNVSLITHLQYLMLTWALFFLLSQTPAHHSSLPDCLSFWHPLFCICSYPGDRPDQWLCHIQALPAAGAARGPHPLLRLWPVQQRPLPARRHTPLHQRAVQPPAAEDVVVIWEGQHAVDYGRNILRQHFSLLACTAGWSWLRMVLLENTLCTSTFTILSCTGKKTPTVHNFSASKPGKSWRSHQLMGILQTVAGIDCEIRQTIWNLVWGPWLVYNRSEQKLPSVSERSD